MRWKIAYLAALALLSACTDTPSTVSADNGRVWEHRCPPAGTVVRMSTGGTIRYAGADAEGLCRRVDGTTALYGVWMMRAGQQPSAEVRAWLGKLFPARAGASATASMIGLPVNGGTDTHMWMREARVVGFERLNLPAGAIDAVLIEWNDRGTGNNIHLTRYRRWLDTNTGAMVRSEAVLLSGAGREHAWHAVALTVPPRGTP